MEGNSAAFPSRSNSIKKDRIIEPKGFFADSRRRRSFQRKKRFGMNGNKVTFKEAVIIIINPLKGDLYYSIVKLAGQSKTKKALFLLNAFECGLHLRMDVKLQLIQSLLLPYYFFFLSKMIIHTKRKYQDCKYSEGKKDAKG